MKLFPNVISILFLTTLYCGSGKLSGQEGFRGAAIVGSTFAQIDGDRLVGYRKAGFTGGLKLSAAIKGKIRGNLELLYSQRGSGERLFSGAGAVTTLGYFELPIYVSITDWYVESDDFSRLEGYAGLSLGTLFQSTTTEDVTDYRGEDLEMTDVSWLLGAKYNFTRHIGVSARFTRSFTRLLEDPMLFNEGLVGYFWSVRAEYTF